MNARTVPVCGLLAVSLFVTPAFILGQSKRSKSDENIDAIGHRNIAQGPNNYSLESEKQVGENLAKEVAKVSKFVSDPEIMGYLRTVDQNVEQNSDKHIPITLHLIDSDTISAYTLAGGQQFFTRGLLLRIGSEGELASMLARGIAVTALRSDTILATKLGLMQISSVPIDSAIATAMPNNGLPIAAALETLKMRRDAVFDADYFGVQYLYKSGYDPQCFTEFIQRMEHAAKPVSNRFSGYPTLTERLRALQHEIADILPKRDEAILTTREFQQFKERLRNTKSEGVVSRNRGV